MSAVDATSVDASPLGPPGPSAAAARSQHPFARFIGRRLAAGALTLFVASILIFLAVQALPGDVASVVGGRNATPATLAAIRQDLGLDRSLPVRYFDWLGGVLTGDLGNSTVAVAKGDPNAGVWDAIRTPLGNSLVLAFITLAILIPVGLALGAFAAMRAGKPTDQTISTTALTFSSMPEFLIGTLFVVVFFTQLNWLPPISQIQPGETPFTHPDALVLPVATLLAVSLAFTIRLVRAATIETLRQDYVAMARLNGFRSRRVLWKYALRNAVAPSVQAIAQTTIALTGGIIITESVFAYPGIGNALVQAVAARDVTTIAGITFILAAFYIVVNILADLIVVLLVPKLRTAA